MLSLENSDNYAGKKHTNSDGMLARANFEMQRDSDIYEEVDKVRIKKNECYEDHVTETARDSTTKKRIHAGQKHVLLGVTFAILVLVLGVLVAITVYALAEIYHMKSAMLEMSATLESTKLHFRNTAELLDARISQVQNFTLQNLNCSISDIDARLTDLQVSSQQYTTLQNLNNSISEIAVAFDARISQVQNSSQGEAEETATSISAISTILGQGSSSCDTLPTSSPAGYYNFTSANGSLLHQYCPPISTRCGLPGRWRSVADLDMTNSTHQCYSPLRQHTYSNKRLCVRSSENYYGDCTPVQLPTNTAYRSVCGVVIAYQFGTPEAFFYFESSIDDAHVDGVSITHGSPRQHIWTFAATVNENSGHTGCPCMGGRDRRPRFVKNDYFCDTGTSTGTGGVFYGDNPLWDGAGCGPTSSCCDFNNPPWFYKELPQYTYDDIELRLCNSYVQSNEDISLEKVEIFVK